MTDEPPFLYLTTTGWRSGHPHEIEIWFVSHAGCYYVVSENGERSHWVQNIRRQSAITFRVGDHTWTGTGRVIEASAEPDLAATVAACMEEKYAWSEGLIVELTPAPDR